jgi:cysteinyl-tRNA synthetase
VVLRYLLATPHYRSSIEVNQDSMVEATAAFERIEGFVLRATERLAGLGLAEPSTGPVPPAFAAALDDDLSTPAGVAVLHDTVREGNVALTAGDDNAVQRALHEVREMTRVLGVDPLDPHWRGGDGAGDGRLREALDILVRAELDARAQARKERDFGTADAIRNRLIAAGVAVEDTPDGARWTLETNDNGR